MVRSIFIGLALLLALGATWQLWQGMHISAAVCPNGCNTIVIVVDTLSARHLETYGYARETMPRVNRFFENAIIFDNAASVSPWTLPSFASIFFSNLPSTLSFHDLDTRINLISVLRANSVAIRGILVPNLFFITDAIYRPFLAEERIYAYETLFTTALSEVTRLSESSAPFFLLIHSFEVHDPFQPKEPYNGMFDSVPGYERITMSDLIAANATTTDRERNASYALRYDQGIRAADDRIGAFLESIPAEILDSTVIILTSDHGEAFGEHDKVWHANNIYEEEVHVPLLMRIPGLSGKRISTPVSLIDLAPTILDFANIDTPREFTGSSLVPLILGDETGERTVLLEQGFPFFLSAQDITPDLKPFASLKEAGAEQSPEPLIQRTHAGVRIGSQKLISGPDGLEYYDLAADPDESENRSSELSALPRTLLEAFIALIAVRPTP